MVVCKKQFSVILWQKILIELIENLYKTLYEPVRIDRFSRKVWLNIFSMNPQFYTDKEDVV